MRRPHLALALLCFAVLTLVFPAAASAAESEQVTKRFPLDPGGTLRLKTFSGRVTITADDRNEVVIEAVRRATRSRLDHIKLDIHVEGSTIVVDANHRDSWGWFSHDNVVETDFDIKVPRRTNLDLNVFSAPVTVEGIEGSSRVRGFSSRVRLNDVSGSVRAHTFSGPVEIREKNWQDDSSIDVDTFSGSVTLHVPEAARGSVSFKSFSGHLNSDLPLTLHRSSRRSLTADLGDSSSGGTLRFQTFSGSVRIDR
jgi:hypothetical protein